MKVCYVDVETTGLSAYKNDIIQIAGIIAVDGIQRESFNFCCKPYDLTTVSDRALAVNGLALHDILRFDPPEEILMEVIAILDKYVDRFDKKDKFIFAGYNANFDKDFVQQWFKKGGNKFFHSYFEYKFFDVYPLFFLYAQVSKLSIPNHKLETAAKHFGITINAHDALSDIEATVKISDILCGFMKAGIEVQKQGRIEQ